LEDIMTQIDLGPLNEDCIALRDGLACKCEEDGQPVLALTLRQIASRYQRLLNKLFAEQANDAAEKRVAELEVRAEAAEAKAATLLKVVEEHEVMARLLMSELSAQAKRLAELEEAPTGLEWQPVRNAPPEGCVEMRVWPTYDPYDNEYQFGYETVRVANIMRAKGQWRPVAAEEEGD